MSKELINQVIWDTEISLHGKLKATKPQWAMWLSAEGFLTDTLASLSLRPVRTPGDWNDLFRLRKEVEVPFGVSDDSQIHEVVEEIQRLNREFASDWFIAQDGEIVVGEVGLVEFDSQLGRIGRLQDVDVLPRHQDRGYGNRLMKTVCALARERNLKALCLKADADRWVKDWYLRLGFAHVGTWMA